MTWVDKLFVAALSFVLVLGVFGWVKAQDVQYSLNVRQAEPYVYVKDYRWLLTIGNAPAQQLDLQCADVGGTTFCTAPLPQGVLGHPWFITAQSVMGSTSSDPMPGAPPSKPQVTIERTLP